MPSKTLFQATIDILRWLWAVICGLFAKPASSSPSHIASNTSTNLQTAPNPPTEPPVELSLSPQEDRPYFILFTVSLLGLYDHSDHGFWDFPERAGWMLDAQGYRENFPTSGAPWDISELDSKYEYASIGEQIRFLQQWLFFGVLAEVSAICGLEIDLRAEFVISASDTGDRTVSTAALNGLPRRWLDALAVRNEDVQREKLGRVKQVVIHILSMQTRYEDPMKRERQLLAYDECKVLLSISLALRAVILALVLSRKCDMEELQSFMDPQVQMNFPAIGDELQGFAPEELITQRGWCASDCKILEHMECPYGFFCTLLKRTKMEHGGCNELMYFADQIDEVGYRTAHVKPDCNCDAIVVDPEQLAVVLAKDKIPRVVISHDYKLTVSEDHAYVAISHVWSHGLGNAIENSLPLCQIRRLKNYIIQQETVLGATPHSLALWIDTLCIPVARSLKQYRKKAIVLMGMTYRSAESVLVLDRDLGDISPSSCSPLEQDLVMIFAGWARRLWTLQEGALARRLYIQTLQEPHEMRVHIANTGNLASTQQASDSESQDQLVSQICYRYDIREYIQGRVPPLDTLQTSIIEQSSTPHNFPQIVVSSTPHQRLWFAVKHRSTSKMEDEAIILATILEKDLSALLRHEQVEKRMSVFLTMMRDLPHDIIFLPRRSSSASRERLPFRPFRWAPQSLLVSGISQVRSFGPPAICDESGLHGAWPGFVASEKTLASTVSRQIQPDGKIYALDKDQDMRYTFTTYHGLISLPARPGFIFGDAGGEVALVNVEAVQKVEDASDDLERNTNKVVYEVTIVGYLVMVASGGPGAWDNDTPQDVLVGKRTEMEQMWCIT